MKTSIAAIASAFLVTCAPVFAQGAAPVASADPAVVAATRQMLAAMHAREMMINSMAQMEKAMPAQLRASATAAINGNPEMTPQQKAEQLAKLDTDVPAYAARAHAVFADPTLVDDMLAQMVPLYAETYTLDEIRQLTAFYTSPLGQKMQATMPALMARTMEINQRIVMPRFQKAMAQSGQDGAGK